LKRNYSLWHAVKHRFRRILLLDDDIELTLQQLWAGATALKCYSIAGFFVTDFPDTSILGHVELAIGDEISTFLSGSCLFLRTDTDLGPFPAVYNEDWIFMAPAIADRRAASLGSVSQEPVDPFADPSLAGIQEPGEILADGLFALLAAGRYAERFEPAVWAHLLSLRSSHLEILAGRARKAEHRLAVQSAVAAAATITGTDCATFMNDWEGDRRHWVRFVGRPA
jgi:hypothetical protein